MVNCLICPIYKKCIASTIADDELKQFKENVLHKSLKKGELIFSENEKAGKIYMVSSGNIKLSKEDGLSYPITLRIVDKGEMIGLEAIINDSYGMTASCFSEVTVCEFKLKQFAVIYKKNNAAVSVLVAQLLNQIIDLNNYSLIMIAGSTTSKIAYSILTLGAEGKIINVSIEEIALMTGASRETVSRILSKLRNQNIIYTDKKMIIVLNENELLKLTKKTKRKLYG